MGVDIVISLPERNHTQLGNLTRTGRAGASSMPGTPKRPESHHSAGQLPHAHPAHSPLFTHAQCRQRLQQEATGRRGTKRDPLYKARRILLKDRATFTGRQRSLLDQLFGNEDNEPLKVM